VGSKEAVRNNLLEFSHLSSV
jgi:hypothetical protein